MYSNKIRNYVISRLSQEFNNAEIARDVKSKFKLEKDLDSIRRWISYLRHRVGVFDSSRKYRRLFFDIETSYYVCRVWSLRYADHLSYENIIDERKVICIAYKYEGEESVHVLDWGVNGESEREMLEKFVSVLNDCDEAIAHNGDRFDLKVLRTRCLYYRIPMFSSYRTFDTLLKSKVYFDFASNKLDYLSRFLLGDKKLEHEGFDLWVKVIEDGDLEALERMKQYCMKDVVLLEDVYSLLSNYVPHNTHMGVIEGKANWSCGKCGSVDVGYRDVSVTGSGIIKRRMYCNECGYEYNISNRSYVNYLKRNIVESKS